MDQLNNVERRVMDMLLAGDDPVLQGLRDQLAACKVANREVSGVGFFTTFKVSDSDAKVAGGKSFKFGDVNATAENLQHGAGFLLYVKDGALEMLEGYTYDEPWPSQIVGLKLSYDKRRRNLDALRTIWD